MGQNTSQAALTASPLLRATMANETAPAIAVHKSFVCHAVLSLTTVLIVSSCTALRQSTQNGSAISFNRVTPNDCLSGKILRFSLLLAIENYIRKTGGLA